MRELYLVKRSAAVFLLVLICTTSVLSQQLDLKRSIIHELSRNGFENIIVRIDSESAIIAYENRVYRFDPEALRVVLKLMVPLIKDQDKIVLVAQNRQVPIVSLEASVSDCRDYFDSKISGREFAGRITTSSDVDEVYSKLLGEEIENSSSFRFDVALKPQMKFQFGPYGHPVTSQVNVVPELQTSWFKGMQFNYELIVPVVNEFGTSGESVRPGIVALNQVYRFADNYFLSASAGIFTQSRFGFDLEAAKYLWNSNLSYGINIGLTSTLYLYRMNQYYYANDILLTGLVHCNYRIPQYDLTLGVMAGKFLLGDKSLRFDVSREFGEFDIGFFALHAVNGVSNEGINITIPLFPSRYWKPDVVRLRSDENYTLSYLTRTNPSDFIGLRYNTLNRLEYFNKKLNPDFIKNYFSSN